jgi:hypothetical protein
MIENYIRIENDNCFMKIGKGEPGGECPRAVCKNKPAIGFNRSTGLWYCRTCSTLLNVWHKQESESLYKGDLVILPNRPLKRNDGKLIQ